MLYGTRLTDGRCHYDYPEIRVPDGATAWEVRDIGIDPVRCRKLVEEGIPAEPDPTLSAGEKQRTEATAEISESPASGGDAVTSTASGYHWVWWEDVLGIKMTQDRTNISWSYNGTCSTSGSTSGEWTWAWGTGWQILSYGGSEYESCAYYRGTTYSSFKNADFCPPGLPTVYTYYYYVRAYGYPNGSIGGTRSTDSVNECFWFWMHYQIRKVT